MTHSDADQKNIPTLVKDPELVERRRRQIIEAAVSLFVRKGFHPTTTREIAQAAGLSIGSLYEYVQSKQDVLYLVCETIHTAVRERLESNLSSHSSGRELLAAAIREYFLVCDQMADMILLIYQESNSLEPDSLHFVLKNEERITFIFREILNQGVQSGLLRMREDKEFTLLAHTIAVLGHMWTFRRWTLQRSYTLEEYTRFQTELVLGYVD